MALTKEEEIDRIEIVGKFRHVQVRKATVIREDGKELSRSFKRYVVSPDSDTSNETQEVKDICNIVHDDAVKTAWEIKKQKDLTS